MAAFRQRIERRQALIEAGMTPEEVAAAARRVRAGWCDEDGVLHGPRADE